MKKIIFFISVFIITSLLANCVKHDNEKPDYAEKVEGEYFGKMRIFFSYSSDSIIYNNINFPLLYINTDTVEVELQQKISLIDNIYSDIELDFKSFCVVKSVPDNFTSIKAYEIIGDTITKLKFFTESQELPDEIEVNVSIGGIINEKGKAIVNISVIEDPIPITFIFEGNRKSK